MNDLRFAFRQFVKNPGFTIVAVLTLALGIGANTAIFSVVNAVLLRPLPVKDPHQLVQAVISSASPQPDYAMSYPLFQRLRDNATSVSELFAVGGVGLKDRLRTPGADVEFVRAQPVSGNFFTALGADAALGRIFTSAEDQPGNARPVVVISHSFWQRRFGGDQAIVGKSVIFNDIPFTIIGVMKPDFFGFQPGENPELWWPLQMAPQIDRDPAGQRLQAGSSWLRVAGRLAPNATRQKAEAELAVIYQRYRDEFAASRAAKWSPEMKEKYFTQRLEVWDSPAGWTALRDQIRQPLKILMCAVAITLAIACANVASLLLARATARRREFSIRQALGAGRARLMRQLLTEGIALAACGAAVGVLFAQFATTFIQRSMHLRSDPVSMRMDMDAPVLGFTIVVTLLSALIFGLAPLFQGRRFDLVSGIKGSSGSIAASPGTSRSMQVLVVTQVALSLILLVGAGLFVRTLKQFEDLDAGFARNNVILFNLDFPTALTGQQLRTFQSELLSRLESLPHTASATVFNFGFLTGNYWTDTILAEGVQDRPGEDFTGSGVMVGPAFFDALGMRLIAGRHLNDQDQPTRGGAPIPHAIVINEKLATRWFGADTAIGRRLFFPSDPGKRFEVVGVVADAKYRSLRTEAPPTFYFPFFRDDPGATFAVRTTVNPEVMMATVRVVVQEIDRTVRIRDLRTLDNLVNGTIRQERTVAHLGGLFGLFAVALACIGLYGVLSFAVAQRTREIGVRIALGARQSTVLSLIIGKGLKLVFLGAAIGLAGALAVTRLVSSLLFGVAPNDPLTFAAVLIALVVVATLASWLPARRAAAIDPMRALRCE